MSCDITRWRVGITMVSRGITTVYLLLLVLCTNASGVNKIFTRLGDDVILPFEHMGRCNREMRLCHLPLLENRTAHPDASACWTPRCQAITTCKHKSKFVISAEYEGRAGVRVDGPEGLSSEVLFNITTDDAGMYQFCNSWRAHPEMTMLVIQDQPIDPYVQTPHLPLLDSTYTLTCVTKSRSIPANHGLPMSYVWKRNGDNMKITQNLRISGPVLTIQKLSMEYDKDEFSCLVKERDGHWTRKSPALVVAIQYGPQVIDMLVTEEDTGLIKLTCYADCRPECSLVLEHNGYDVTSSHNTITMDFFKTPEIGAVYICTAKNTHGTLSKNFVFFRHQSVSKVTGLTANRKHGEHITIKENQTLHLSCTVTGRPEPEVTWYYSNGGVNQTLQLLKTSTFKPAYTANAATDVKHLYISVYIKKETDCNQNGWYYCRAANGLATEFHEKFLRVTVKCIPRVVRVQKGAAILGQPLKQEITVMSHTRPTANCNRIGDNATARRSCGFNVTVTSDPSRPIIYLVSLQKEVVEEGDLGVYVVRLSNDEGTLEEEFPVKFEDMYEDDSLLYFVLSGVVVGVVSLTCILMVAVISHRRRNDEKCSGDGSVKEFTTRSDSTGSFTAQDSITTHSLSRGDSGWISTGEGSKSPSVVRLLQSEEKSYA